MNKYVLCWRLGIPSFFIPASLIVFLRLCLPLTDGSWFSPKKTPLSLFLNSLCLSVSLSLITGLSMSAVRVSIKRGKEEEEEEKHGTEESEETETDEEDSDGTGEEEEEEEEAVAEDGRKRSVKMRVVEGEGTSSAKAWNSKGGSLLCCQVDECGMDLKMSKPYYMRHRVCELHAKASLVLVNGIRLRFCQQCSRFHDISEFDGAKRSCRERLAGHNERRRKAYLDLQERMQRNQHPPE